MRFIGWNVALATWLLLSAFALPQTPATAAATAVAAFVVPLVALFAGARPGARYLISMLAVLFAGAMLLLPGVPAVARVNDLAIAALLFALSMVSPRHAHAHA